MIMLETCKDPSFISLLNLSQTICSVPSFITLTLRLPSVSPSMWYQKDRHTDPDMVGNGDVWMMAESPCLRGLEASMYK